MGAPSLSLTVEPIAGLGNRMRVVGSALALARATGARLRLIWTRTPDLHCRFLELFEPLPDVVLAERSRTLSRIVRRLIMPVSPRTRIVYQAEIERLLSAGADFPALLRAAPMYVATCTRFFEAPQLLAPLIPAQQLRREVDAFSARFDGHTVGVHIRRRDFAFQHRSPTGAFLARMHTEVMNDSLTRFFVSSDDPDEEALLRQEFGDRILTRPKHFTRSRPEGIRDAVVDLYCLARTRRIVAGIYSSFSEAAAEIGGIERVVIDRPEGV